MKAKDPYGRVAEPEPRSRTRQDAPRGAHKFAGDAHLARFGPQSLDPLWEPSGARALPPGATLGPLRRPDGRGHDLAEAFYHRPMLTPCGGTPSP